MSTVGARTWPGGLDHSLKRVKHERGQLWVRCMFAISNFQPHLVLIIHTLLLLLPTSLVFNTGKALPFKAHCHRPLLSPVPPHSCLTRLRLFVVCTCISLSWFLGTPWHVADRGFDCSGEF